MNRLLLVLPLLAGACVQPPQTITEMDAAELRTIEAPAEAAYAAAAHALADAGYILWVTDADAGLLTGEKRIDPSPAANVAVIILTSLARNPTDLPPEYHAVSIQVRPDGPAKSHVRLRPFVDGAPVRDPELIQHLWTLISREAMGRSR